MAHDESTKFMGPTALAVRYNRCPDTIRRWSKLPGFPKAQCVPEIQVARIYSNNQKNGEQHETKTENS